MSTAADFYTGLVADLYAPLRSDAPPIEPYARFIRQHGEPALELGCGDGDPLLGLRQAGIDVEGVDASADMLERCRDRAAGLGVDVVVHHQRIEHLALGRRFRSIFLAGPTFNLLPDDDAAAAALLGIAGHLEPGGAALVPLFVPRPTSPEHLGRSRSATDGDGAVIRVTAVSESRDEDRRTQTTVLRYERISGAGRECLDRPWTLHWYVPERFVALASAAGLHAQPSGDRFVLRHADTSLAQREGTRT